MKNKGKETWKMLRLSGSKLTTNYAVSSWGRICSFKTSADLKEGRFKVLKGTTVNGYPALKVKAGTEFLQYYVHKLVAQYFVKKKGRPAQFVIHKDYNKRNNHSANLAWAGRAEMTAHQQKSPAVQRYRRSTMEKGHKLTIAHVRKMKSLMKKGKNSMTMSELARRYNISLMQVYRIRSGENWGHVR